MISTLPDKPRGILTGVLLLAVVVALDHLTGIEISFSIFYVAPIARVAWLAGRRWGVFFALLGATLWFAADQIGGHVTSHPLIPVWNAFARMVLFLVTVEAVTRLHASLQRERELARLDPLTRLPNARSFREFAESELRRAKRYGRSFSVAYIDVDNFKWVNDQLGHKAGDRVLERVASLLRKELRHNDYVARLGGDEFAVLMPETPLPNARIALDKILQASRNLAKEEGWPISFSIGVVGYETPPETVDDMVRAADELMYEVKRGGKDGVRAEGLAPAMSDTTPT